RSFSFITKCNSNTGVQALTHATENRTKHCSFLSSARFPGALRGLHRRTSTHDLIIEFFQFDPSLEPGTWTLALFLFRTCLYTIFARKNEHSTSSAFSNWLLFGTTISALCF